MTDKILEKLNKHIADGINREADVVYLLVQIRKILELKNIKNKYPILNLYCDWILHPNIDKNGTRVQILNKIGEAVLMLDGGDASTIEKINEAISTQKLLGQMQVFFRVKELDKNFFEDNNWKKFGNLLIHILQDIPLISEQLEFSFSEAVDESHSFRVRVVLRSGAVLSGPISSTLGAPWDMSVSAFGPSGPAHESDLTETSQE